MVCRRVTSFPQLLAILTLVLLTFGKSFSHARRRRVLEVSTVVATDKEFEVLGDSSFSSQKENIIAGGDVPSAATEVKTHKTGGRRMSHMSSSADQKVQNTEASSSAGEEKEEQRKEVLMDFAVDYTSPRAHPPIHN